MPAVESVAIPNPDKKGRDPVSSPAIAMWFGDEKLIEPPREFRRLGYMSPASMTGLLFVS